MRSVNKKNRVRPQVTAAKEVVMGKELTELLEIRTAEHLNNYNSVVGLMLSMGDNIYSTTSSNIYENLDAETASRVEAMFDELDQTFEMFGDHKPDIHGVLMGVEKGVLKTVDKVLEYYSKTSALAAEQIALPTTHLALLAMMPNTSDKDKVDILSTLPAELITGIESELLADGIVKDTPKAKEVLQELQKQYLENPDTLVSKFLPVANEEAKDEEPLTVTEVPSTLSTADIETSVEDAVKAEEDLKSSVKEAVKDIASEASKASEATTKSNSSSSSSSSSSSYSATEVIVGIGLVGLGLFAAKKAYDHFSSDDIVVIDENVSAEDFGWEDIDYNDL